MILDFWPLEPENENRRKQSNGWKGLIYSFLYLYLSFRRTEQLISNCTEHVWQYKSWRGPFAGRKYNPTEKHLAGSDWCLLSTNELIQASSSEGTFCSRFNSLREHKTEMKSGHLFHASIISVDCTGTEVIALSIASFQSIALSIVSYRYIPTWFLPNRKFNRSTHTTAAIAHTTQKHDASLKHKHIWIIR